jgi:chemotaxis protein MotB
MISIRSAKPGLTAGVLLLSAFALAGCMVPKSDLEDAQAQNAQLTTQNQQLQTQVQQLTTQVADDHTQICRLIGAIKYTVNSDLLFPSGSYQMSSAGQQIIGRLASQLAQFQQHHLVVEGYTDNQAIGAQLRRQGIDSNEALSQKRADAVMAYLVSQGVSQDMISAKGNGEANPVASNDTAQGRALNRRVELHLADTGCPTS